VRPDVHPPLDQGASNPRGHRMTAATVTIISGVGLLILLAAVLTTST
jgi:hypothetical protein